MHCINLRFFILFQNYGTMLHFKIINRSIKQLGSLLHALKNYLIKKKNRWLIEPSNNILRGLSLFFIERIKGKKWDKRLVLK